jgi:hypothetical protein
MRSEFDTGLERLGWVLFCVGLLVLGVCSSVIIPVWADSSFSGRGSSAVLDGPTNAVRVIDYEHHEVHEGFFYTASLTTSDLDDNPLNISFTTPNTTQWAHMIVGASTSAAARLELREAPAGGAAGGTALAPLNRDRNSSNTSSLISTHGANANELTQGASAGTGGTVLGTVNIADGKNNLGGRTRASQEFILRANTTYAVRLTGAVNLTIATLEIDWYEHTNR